MNIDFRLVPEGDDKDQVIRFFDALADFHATIVDDDRRRHDVRIDGASCGLTDDGRVAVFGASYKPPGLPQFGPAEFTEVADTGWWLCVDNIRQLTIW